MATMLQTKNVMRRNIGADAGLDKRLIDDPILNLLTNQDASAEDFKSVMPYMDPVQAQDITTCFHMLDRLEKYSREILAWPYQILANYQFHSQARQFDLDLAVLVGSRATSLLKEIYSWNIKALKDKAYKLSVLSSDANMVLTMLILRIGEEYDDLELDLQLAISRSTLVKIDHELVGLLSKFPNAGTAAGTTGKSNIKGQVGPPLVEKYRAFVKQLLSELKTTPFETVQQEMFQVVHDLQQMFLKFQSQHLGDENHSFNSNNNSSILNQPLPFENQGPPSPTLVNGEDVNSTSHKHKYSTSESSYTNSSTAKPSIREELPSIMKAFDIKQHSRDQNQHWGLSERQLAHFQEHNQYYSGTKLKQGLNDMTSKPSYSKGGLSSLSESRPQQPTSSTSTLQVATINGKVMVATENGYQDMQQWLNSQSGGATTVSNKKTETPSSNKLSTLTGRPNSSSLKSSTQQQSSQAFGSFSRPFPLNVSWPFVPGQKEQQPLNQTPRSINSSKMPTQTTHVPKPPETFQDHYNDMMNFYL